MRQFQRGADGLLTAEMNADEAALLQALAGQVAEMISEGVAQDDPVLARLLPDAHPDDPVASAEFRRFTEHGLATRKLDNAGTVISSLETITSSGAVALDDAQALAWLRSLTDIRLTIAMRLGIDSEDDDAGRDINPVMRDIYDWLGFVQNSLVDALDSPPLDSPRG